MTRIKLCGMTRECDIDAANTILPEYIGFVFAQKSKRFVTAEQAFHLKSRLSKSIKSVGVFVRTKPEIVAAIAKSQIIDIIQLHGGEPEEYIKRLKTLTDKPIIKTFSVKGISDIEKAEKSSADFVLLDSGPGGTGTAFDWELLKHIKREYFLAGGLDENRVKEALKKLSPFGVDVSSGIETNGLKDREKMERFVRAVRNFENR